MQLPPSTTYLQYRENCVTGLECMFGNVSFLSDLIEVGLCADTFMNCLLICCRLNLIPGSGDDLAFVLACRVRRVQGLGPDPEVEIVFLGERFCLICNISAGQVRIVCSLHSFSFSMWSSTTASKKRDTWNASKAGLCYQNELEAALQTAWLCQTSTPTSAAKPFQTLWSSSLCRRLVLHMRFCWCKGGNALPARYALSKSIM